MTKEHRDGTSAAGQLPHELSDRLKRPFTLFFQVHAAGGGVPRSLSMFMLSLAIVDDIGAMLVVALGYSDAIDWRALAWAVAGLVLLRAAAWAGIRGFPVYFLLGSFIWVAVDASGVHATATGVVLGLMTPARRWVTDDRLYAILDRVVAHPKIGRAHV